MPRLIAPAKPPCLVCRSRAHLMVKRPVGWVCVYCNAKLGPVR